MTIFSAFRRGRFPLLVLFSLFSLLAAGLAVAVLSERAIRTQQASQAEAQADLLASAVSGALAFGDRKAAQDYVDAVQVNPDVLVAAVYDDQDRLIASFARGGEVALPRPRRHAAATLYEDGYLRVIRPVEESGQRIGMAGIRLRVDSPSQRFSRYAGLLVILGFSSLVVAILAVAQNALRRANRELERRAEALSASHSLLEQQMAEREKVEEALRQSQKMEAIGRLTGGVAHDFNNLLMVASSGIELLERTEDPKRRAMLSEGVRQAVARGSALTRQLLAFSRSAPLKSEVLDLNERVTALRFLLERSLRENIQVIFELGPDLWAVEADPGELELALLNVAVNARDAMPGSGSLTIATRNLAAENGDEEAVVIEITDTGTGMSEDLLLRVFEPFFTTKEVGRGTGLGLSQVYGFARSSGGEANIRSSQGVGTTISLRLPRSRKPLSATKAGPSPSGAPPMAPQDCRLLLVEDDDAVAASVGHMLRDLGFTYVRAASAAQALTHLETRGGFDIVFSDMIMPGAMDGLTLAKEIQRRYPELPVVLTTGYSQAAAQASIERYRLLNKPYGIHDLAQALAQALRRPIGGA
ncbi:MAG: integral rane sensor hybrid histidine kinase [Brevundimonas sp.]|nr:integral rane sensor hybrid histidine kinase [Brevundimonas sp.]